MSFRLSGINLYLFLTTIAAILLGSAFLLMKYTPLPVWAGIDMRSRSADIDRVQEHVALLQQRIDAQSDYIKVLQTRMKGEEVAYPLQDTLLAEVDTTEESSARIALDDTLRRRVQRSNINIPVRTPLILSVAEEGEIEDEYLIPPIRGVVRHPFSAADNHFGVDIIAPENSAVKCVLDGIVIESDWTLEGGNSIMVQHENNVVTCYKHNSALLKRRGDRVRAGEAIAIIGNTGLHTDGPHVHFELWHDQTPLDPERYIGLERE